MPRIFVCYSRSDRAKVKTLIPLLREDYGLGNVWWDENFHGGQVWWDEILRQIAQCDVFVYLLSPRSLGSPYCQAELEEARRLRKPILPVKLRRDTAVPDILAKMDVVNLAGPVNRATIAPLRRLINQYASHPPSELPALTPTPVAIPRTPPRSLWGDYGARFALGIVGTVIIGIVLVWFLQQFVNPLPFALLPMAPTPVTRNADWTPVTQDFNGVMMVLVPAGCFLMGSNDSGYDQQPVHRQCFYEPFWIDQTEVTQADFERLGGRKANLNEFEGDQRPVNQITWFEARDFCLLRGARLPTEREWEYAARGPDNLIYPWGNTWNENNAVHSGNSNNRTANVGSRPAGQSWVGALDVSGNMWEWTSTIYGVDDGDYNYNEGGERLYTYRYSETDGRELDSDERRYIRVVRGGSWLSVELGMRAANRQGTVPDLVGNSIGFRCARSYNADF